MLFENTSVSVKCGLISNAVFWATSLLGLYADHLAAEKKSPLLERCKLQPQRYLSRKERKDLILLTSFNMIFVVFFVCCPLYEYAWNWFYAGPDRHRLKELDDWIWYEEVFFKIPLHVVITEMGFYFTHRMLHSSSWLYRNVHRVHHRFPAPTAMTCVYAHPLEFAIGNIGPIWAGPILTNAHPVTCYLLWFPMAMFGTCKGHCGYRIMGHVDQHDDHHLLFNCNYGGLYLSDYLLGTAEDSRVKKKNFF